MPSVEITVALLERLERVAQLYAFSLQALVDTMLSEAVIEWEDKGIVTDG